MWWTGQKSQKYILPNLPNAIRPAPPLTSMRNTKDNFATGNGELSKVIAEIKTTAPLLLDNKSTVKHATWRNNCSQSCM